VRAGVELAAIREEVTRVHADPLDLLQEAVGGGDHLRRERAADGEKGDDEKRYATHIR
jgi:hypothetical protein